MATVRLDAMLREFAPLGAIPSSAPTVGSVLDDLEERFPRLKFKLRDELGTVRRFVRVFVNGTGIERLNGLETPLASSDQVDILHSIQGG